MVNLWRRRPAQPETARDPAEAGPASTTSVDAEPRDPAARFVHRAVLDLAGANRTLLYGVPRDQAPAPLAGTPIFLRGSPAWQTYLRARERLDTGDLTLLVALRPLAPTERLLAVDWGTTYANTFLLVEPRDPACDLTDPTNAVRRRLEALARALLGRDGAAPPTRETTLGAALRGLYGVWVSWAGPPHDGGQAEEHLLTPAGSGDTLAALVRARLRECFPPAAFEDAFAHLHDREAELFNGRPIGRARTPFLTRLGLPVLYDPSDINRAARRLINAGRVWAYRHGPDGVSFHGPERPVPDTMSDAELERLIM